MSGCPAFEEAIALHAAGGLDGPERDELERHLAACPACAAELAETRVLLAELASGAPALSPAREAAFASRVRAEAERAAPAAGPARARRPWAVRTVAGAGALAAAAALALSLRPPAPAPEAAPTPTTAAEPADPAAALAEDLAALAAADAEAADLVPEPDAGFGLDGLTDDELQAMETLLASTGG